METYIIGVTGGSGSGKTLFLKQLQANFEPHQISLLSMDNYYKPIEVQQKDEKGIENFDVPEAIDRKRFHTDLSKLKEGKSIEIEEYTFNNFHAKPNKIQIQAAPIMVVEGIFTFYFEEIAQLTDLKIFIDAPDYLMLTRRITRDAQERGYDLNDVLYRYQHHVTPAYTRYIAPYISQADIVIPNHHHFDNALKVIEAFLRAKLQ